MLFKTLAAALLALGLVLPYERGSRAIAVLWTAWRDPQTLLLVGVPVVAAIAYVLHTTLPPVAHVTARYGRGLHGLLRVVYFLLAGAYLHAGLVGEGDTWAFWAPALLVTGALLWWQQQRGTKVDRLPLLFLVIVGLPAVSQVLSELDVGALEIGGWVFTAGYVAAVALEVRDLRKAPKVAHGG